MDSNKYQNMRILFLVPLLSYCKTVNPLCLLTRLSDLQGIKLDNTLNELYFFQMYRFFRVGRELNNHPVKTFHFINEKTQAQVANGSQDQDEGRCPWTLNLVGYFSTPTCSPSSKFSMLYNQLVRIQLHATPFRYSVWLVSCRKLTTMEFNCDLDLKKTQKVRQT